MKVKLCLTLFVLALIFTLNSRPTQAFGVRDIFDAVNSFRGILGESTQTNSNKSETKGQKSKNNIASERRSLKDVRVSNLDDLREKFASRTAELKEKFASRSGELNERSASRSGNLKEKACEARQAAALKRGGQFEKLVIKMIENFDSIAKRVEDYYLTKLVPSGKTVSNYDVLVANIATAKQAVLDSLDTAQSTSLNVNCATVKDDLTILRTDSQKLKTALHQYRTAIKNLIVAVRTANGSKGSRTATSSGENNSTESGTTSTSSAIINP